MVLFTKESTRLNLFHRTIIDLSQWPSRYHHVTAAYSSNYQRKSLQIDFRRNLFSNIPFLAVQCSVCMVHIKWSVDMSECDLQWFALIVQWIREVKQQSRKDSLMNLDVNICKNQRRVCFIRREEFFSYILIISTKIFKIWTFVYQVIILLNANMCQTI